MSQGRAFPAGSRFLLGRQALLILDGCLWMLAGAAVVWLGLRAYGTLPRVGWVRPLLTFLLFQGLDGPFLAVTWKETRRIRGSAQPARRPIWQALAGKSWLVLAGSVGGSLWLWRSGWVPAEAAAVICTALGGALALAGSCSGWPWCGPGGGRPGGRSTSLMAAQGVKQSKEEYK